MDGVTRKELDGDLADVRGETGVLLARLREEWREELDLRFKAWAERLERRGLYAIVGLAGVLKFDVPNELTVGALAVAAVAALAKAISARFPI